MPDEPAPTPEPPPVPVIPTAAAAPAMVSIALDQLQTFASLQTRLAQMEADIRQRETAATEERVRILTEKNDAVNAVKTIRETKDAELKAANDARVGLEDRAKRYALDGELSRVLASQPLVAGAAEQLTELFRKHFTVAQEGETFAVRTPTFQTVEAYVTETLAKPGYAHFIRAANPGGGTAGTTGGHEAAPTGDAAQPVVPRNLDEAIILDYRESRKTQQTDPRLNPRVAHGIRPQTG